MSRLPGRPKESKLPGPIGQAPVFQILTGSHKGRQFRLLSSKITIGRHRDCDVIFRDNANCSKYHARIKKKDGSYLIESLDLKKSCFDQW